MLYLFKIHLLWFKYDLNMIYIYLIILKKCLTNFCFVFSRDFGLVLTYIYEF